MQQEVSGSLSLFSSQVVAIERAQAELLEVVEMSRRAAEHQADALTRQLELEVKELRRKETVLDELTQSEDSTQCLMVNETSRLQNTRFLGSTQLMATLKKIKIYKKNKNFINSIIKKNV